MRFFLIDKVTELVVGERARGVKAVTLTDEVLHDHFPEFPVMPGTLIIEGVAQLAGLLLETTALRDRRAKGVVGEQTPLRAILSQINDARFYSPAGPGDRLEIEVTLVSMLDVAAKVRGEVTCEGRRLVRSELTFALRAIESPSLHEQRRALYRVWTRGLDPTPELP
jgi:3-hydroxyacyl-[acyl-carrier-protein] dehydratase